MRALVSIVLTAVTVVVQLTIVDRIAFPGGGGPDLVLLLVAALALAGGPMAGVLTGFFAGLALDVAPPGSHFTGQDALVFCLVGYACGLLCDDFSGDAEQGHTALFEIVATAAGAVCGEALAALLGVMLSDPRVSWPAITNVLPAAMAYNVLLCPFVLYAAAAALRLAGVRREGRRPGFSASQARSQRPATSQGAIRQREPQLKLGRPAARPAPRPATAFSPVGLAAGSARVKFGGGRRREGVLGGSLLGGASFGGASFGGSRLSGSRLGGSGMGRSLLGGSVFSRSSSPLASGPVLGRSAPLGRPSPFRHRANLMRSAGGGLTRRAPRLSRGGTPKSPGRNWLRGASSRGTFTRRKSLGSSGLSGKGLSGKSLSGKSLSGKALSGKALSGKALSGKGLSGKSLSGKSLSGKSLSGKSLSRKAFGRSRMSQPRLRAKRGWGRRGYL